MKILLLLMAVLILSQRSTGQTGINNPANKLRAYEGTWVIFNEAGTQNNNAMQDTLCKTLCIWSASRDKLIGVQQIHEKNGISKDSCFYGYDSISKIFTYYE